MKENAMKEKYALAGQNLHLFKHHYVCVVECAGIASFTIQGIEDDRPESRNDFKAIKLLQKET